MSDHEKSKRSVPIPPGARLSPAGKAQRPDEPRFRAMAMAAPPPILTHGPQAALLKVQPSRLQVSPSTVSQKPCRPCCGWSKANLTRMSMFHPAEQYHVCLPRQHLTTLLERLPQGFQKLSLRVFYQSSPIQAQCQTMEQVEFAVTLLAAQDGEIMVEVQRVAGDAIVFGSYAQQVIKACQGLEACQAPCALRNMPMPRLFHAQRLLHQAMSDGEAVEDALHISQHLVMSPCCDARRLGLESLVILTDVDKTNRSQAQTAASAVLLGLECSCTACACKDRCQCIPSRILCLTMNNCWPSNDTPCKEAMMDVDREEDDQKDAYLALVCVAQALECLDAAPNVEHCLEACRKYGEHELVDVLLQKIEHASDHPHVAFYSVKALGVLSHHAPHVLPEQARTLVAEAQQVGSERHAALASISGHLLESMQM